MNDNPYGVTIYGGIGSSVNWALLMADVTRLGITWIRFQDQWSDIENPQGTFTWTKLDTAVSNCNAAGVNIVFCLQDAPSWALTTLAQKATTEPFYLPDPVLMAGFASQVATRYNGKNGHGFINAIEIGNEEFNIHYVDPSMTTIRGTYNSPYTEYNAFSTPVAWNIQPGRDPHFYVPVLKACSPMIRAASPSTKVGMASVWWRNTLNYRDFMTGIYAELPNAASYFDYANFHFYPSSSEGLMAPNISPFTDIPSITQAWAAIQSAMQAAGDSNKPIWLTEFNWTTSTVGGRPAGDVVSGADQSTYIQDVLDSARQSLIVAKVFPYSISYDNDGMSLVQGTSAPYTYQPAYSMLQGYIQQYPQWYAPITQSYVPRAFGGAFIYNTTGAPMTLVKYNPVYVEAGSLSIDNAIARRAQTSFDVLSDTATHFQQYQPVMIYDSNTTLIFSGGIRSPKEQKPGFQANLYHTITCDDQTWTAVKRVVAASYTNKTCGFIVQDILKNVLAAEGIVYGRIYDGLTPSTTLYPGSTLYPDGNIGPIPSATFVYCTVAQALDELAKAASEAGIPYYWSIDQFNQLWFVPYTAVVNSTLVDGTQIDQVRSVPTVTRANPTYRNTQYLLGGTAETVSQTETRKGDSNTTAFTMGFEFSRVPTVTVNGVSKTVGIKGVETGKDWYWNKGDPTLTQDTAGVKLTSSDTLQVVYIGQYSSVIIDQNAAQISYERDLDGTSGIVEQVETDATITSVTTGFSKTSALLTLYGNQGLILEFSTLQTGFAPGQLITVDLPDHGIYSTQMLIEETTASDQQDGLNIWYKVKAVVGPFDTSWPAFFSKQLKQQATANSINVGVSQSVQLLLSMTATIVPTASVSITVHACPIPSTSLFPSTTLYCC